MSGGLAPPSGVCRVGARHGCCVCRLQELPMTRASRPVFVRFLAALLAVGLLASGCASLEEKERELTFRVVKGDAGWYSGTPSGVQDIYIPVGEGPKPQRIHAWYWPDADPAAPVVYFLHGVRWNLTGQVRRLQQLHDFGFSVFAIDYRGFGKSDGVLPSEQMTYEDAEAGWKWLLAKVPDASRRFIYGHSLGGAVAIDLAARLAARDNGTRQAHGLIVESTFTSLPDIAAELSWSWLPTRLIMSQRFDSIDKVKGIDLPVLFVHGTGDRYVPAKFSQALYEAAPNPKKLLLIENGGHNNAMWIGNAEYQGTLVDFFAIRAKEARAARRASR
jgi:pimeloyl-ACP methyl ester carboxylesterase